MSPSPKREAHLVLYWERDREDVACLAEVAADQLCRSDPYVEDYRPTAWCEGGWAAELFVLTPSHAEAAGFNVCPKCLAAWTAQLHV